MRLRWVARRLLRMQKPLSKVEASRWKLELRSTIVQFLSFENSPFLTEQVDRFNSNWLNVGLSSRLKSSSRIRRTWKGRGCGSNREIPRCLASVELNQWIPLRRNSFYADRSDGAVNGEVQGVASAIGRDRIGQPRIAFRTLLLQRIQSFPPAALRSRRIHHRRLRVQPARKQ